MRKYLDIYKYGPFLMNRADKLKKIRSEQGGDRLGSVIKKRRKKMTKHKHKKLLARTRHQRRKGK